MALTLSDIIGTETFAPATSFSQSLTVPSGCGAVLVCFSHYTSGVAASITSPTLNGSAPTDSVSAATTNDTANHMLMFAGPGSGSKTLTMTMSTLNAASRIGVVYLSTNVDSSAFGAKNALASGAGQSDSRSFTLSGLTVGDLVVQYNGDSDNSQTYPSTPSGWQSVLGVGIGVTEEEGRVSAIVATGTSQACAAQANLFWSNLSGVALKEVSQTLLPPHARSFSPDGMGMRTVLRM